MVSSGYVGILSFDLHFPDEHSLKGKRRHLLSLKADLAQKAGASVAEVAHHDLWQRTRLTVAIVDRGLPELDQRLDRCVHLVEHHGHDASSIVRAVVTPEDLQ